MKTGEINSLFKNLSKVIKNPKSDLKYKSKFTLLVSVVLSAQCTDVNVNNVTKNIYPKYNKPDHFVKLGRKKIEKLIKSIGLFRNKSKSVYLLSKQLIEKHNGKISKKKKRSKVANLLFVFLQSNFCYIRFFSSKNYRNFYYSVFCYSIIY